MSSVIIPDDFLQATMALQERLQYPGNPDLLNLREIKTEIDTVPLLVAALMYYRAYTAGSGVKETFIYCGNLALEALLRTNHTQKVLETVRSGIKILWEDRREQKIREAKRECAAGEAYAEALIESCDSLAEAVGARPGAVSVQIEYS